MMDHDWDWRNPEDKPLEMGQDSPDEGKTLVQILAERRDKALKTAEAIAMANQDELLERFGGIQQAARKGDQDKADALREQIERRNWNAVRHLPQGADNSDE